MNDWRDRIRAAAKKDGRSLRDISLAAGLSHGYLHGILNGKEPTMDRFTKICAELDLSLSYALMGIDMTPKTEAIMREIEAHPGKQDALIALLSSGSGEAPSE